MRRSRSPIGIRHDGWTVARQLDFLDMLALTRSVARAAGAGGMSRKGAYRLRNRPHADLFAATWDRAIGAGRPAPCRAEVDAEVDAKVDEGHIRAVRRAGGTEGANLRVMPRGVSTS